MLCLWVMGCRNYWKITLEWIKLGFHLSLTTRYLSIKTWLYFCLRLLNWILISRIWYGINQLGRKGMIFYVQHFWNFYWLELTKLDKVRKIPWICIFIGYCSYHFNLKSLGKKWDRNSTIKYLSQLHC